MYIVLEQQVSLASARAAYDRLCALASPLIPERFLELDDITLKSVGFSRQKTAYGRHLAEAIIQGRFSFDAVAVMDDDSAKSELIKLKGIGSWTADIYLLMALRRPDIWPTGDLALATAVRQVKRKRSPLTTDALEALSQPWKPWRAVAARILWHYYLSRRGRE